MESNQESNNQAKILNDTKSHQRELIMEGPLVPVCKISVSAEMY